MGFMRIVTVSHGRDCFRFSVPEAKDWRDLADYLKPHLRPGDIITLSGPLGAGKTTFVQALATVLGIKRMPQSPTFALMRSYPIPKQASIKRLLHVDAYRIENDRDLLALNLDEELEDGKTILVVEWPERLGAWLHGKNPYAIEITTPAEGHLQSTTGSPRHGGPHRRT